MQALAWICIAADFPLSMLAWGPVFGPIAWVAMLMAGAAAVFSMLNFGALRSR